MSSFALKSDPSRLSLSWESISQLLQDVKQPHTRQRAFDLLLQAHADDIAAMCRSTSWARQWGFEDAYQEAVTHFFETALRTDDPAELTSYWNLRNAVRTEAARNLYPISVSPHFAQKLQAHSFFRELDLVSIPHTLPSSFDELGWHFLQALCQPFLTKRQQSILAFLCQIPGEIPTILELADYLQLSKASAQRAWNYFQKVFKVNVDLVQHLHHFIGFDFLQAYFPQLTIVLEECQQDRSSRKRFKQFLNFHSPLSLLRRFTLQCSQPLVNLNCLFYPDFSSDFGFEFQAIYFRLSKEKFSFQSFNTNKLFKLKLFEFGDRLNFSMAQISHFFWSRVPRIGFFGSLFFPLRITNRLFLGFNFLTDFLHLLFSPLDQISCSNFLFTDLYRQFLACFLAPLRWIRGSPLSWVS
ncbi:hypothetical protein [Picosynechococcus sp. NKBG15041c]|uniref:hypothetical protein n=1 Tax=Picosynechococcus sp. NKBG15041c TaxID=1407650 RepID=UPI00041B5F7B|nr:hypothetical protein [Picosynechococcus sp. NKBG15041c]